MIQIGNSTYKEYDIILLPSDQQVSIIGLYVDTNRLVFNNPDNSDINRGMSYNLYIVSEENICTNDYCIDGDALYGPYNERDIAVVVFKKIIATTDSSLNFFGIHQLPQDFVINYISEYNQGNIITKVLLEVEILTETPFKVYEDVPTKLKLNNNNVIIGVLEEASEQFFTKEQVISLCTSFFNAGESWGINKTREPDYYMYVDSPLKELLIKHFKE